MTLSHGDTETVAQIIFWAFLPFLDRIGGDGQERADREGTTRSKSPRSESKLVVVRIQLLVHGAHILPTGAPPIGIFYKSK